MNAQNQAYLATNLNAISKVQYEENTVGIPETEYNKLVHLGLLDAETRTHNIGTSNYSNHTIQPWSIWMDYNLDGFDADIVKRVLRTKPNEKHDDYRKIIHICQEKLRQLNNHTIVNYELIPNDIDSARKAIEDMISVVNNLYDVDLTITADNKSF